MGTINVFGYAISEEMFMLSVILLMMTAVLFVQLQRAKVYRTAAFAAVGTYKDLRMYMEIQGMHLSQKSGYDERMTSIEKIITDVEKVF